MAFAMLHDQDVEFAGSVNEGAGLADVAEIGFAGEVNEQESIANGPASIGCGLGEAAEGRGGGKEIAACRGHG